MTHEHTPRIIGLMGYAQSGKDTVGKILGDLYGHGRVSFADPLRDVAYESNPTIDWDTGSVVLGPQVRGQPGPVRLQEVVDAIGWDAAKKRFPLVREYLQDLGVGARKVFGYDFWIEQANYKVQRQPRTVITDVRFQNEIDYVRQNRGELWRIERPGVGPVNAHVSEQEWTQVVPDHVIENNGTIQELSQQIVLLLSSPAQLRAQYT